MTKKNKGISIYRSMTCSLLHFVIVQIIALLYAVISSGQLYFQSSAMLVENIGSIVFGKEPPGYYYGYFSKATWSFGYLLFIYAISLAIAAVMSIFQVVDMEEYYTKNKEQR